MFYFLKKLNFKQPYCSVLAANNTKYVLNSLLMVAISLMLLLTNDAQGQEKLVGLNQNALLIHAIRPKEKKTKNTTALDLPFFDDFSATYLYPDPNLWTDFSVFINTSYSKNPPSIGVATLDAIDAYGKIHQGTDYNTASGGDTISSQAINLYYPGDNTIYLSFYYQSTGYGDNPETSDSLILEFYAPEINQWRKVWETNKIDQTAFKQEILAINNSLYLQNGFRFRFRNVVSLSDNDLTSLVGNVDQWHIDYVYLNKDRHAKDTIYRDIAFLEPLQSFVIDYEAMPWTHFLTAPTDFLRPTLSCYYRNNDNTTRLIDSLYFVFDDKMGSRINDTLNAGSYNLNASRLIKFENAYFFDFASDSKDSALFEIQSVIATDDFDPKNNNRMTYLQVFYNYYAYDDGSSERGYGLVGEGTNNASLAYRFVAHKADSLRAVQMYFNQTLNNASQKYFYLCVWAGNGNGQPGELLLRQEGARPEYENELNKYHTYLLDEPLWLTDTFYVGWMQTTTDMLNVGFDMNKINNDKIQYNINGGWIHSSKEGSLMIRPVFGKALPTSIDQEQHAPITKQKWRVFPNPTSNTFYIQTDDNTPLDVEIFDINGKLIEQKYAVDPQAGVSISHLNEGIYFVRLRNQLQSTQTIKIIISKQ